MRRSNLIFQPPFFGRNFTLCSPYFLCSFQSAFKHSIWVRNRRVVKSSQSQNIPMLKKPCMTPTSGVSVGMHTRIRSACAQQCTLRWIQTNILSRREKQFHMYWVPRWCKNNQSAVTFPPRSAFRRSRSFPPNCNSTTNQLAKMPINWHF